MPLQEMYWRWRPFAGQVTVCCGHPAFTPSPFVTVFGLPPQKSPCYALHGRTAVYCMGTLPLPQRYQQVTCTSTPYVAAAAVAGAAFPRVFWAPNMPCAKFTITAKVQAGDTYQHAICRSSSHCRRSFPPCFLHARNLCPIVDRTGLQAYINKQGPAPKCHRQGKRTSTPPTAAGYCTNADPITHLPSLTIIFPMIVC